MHKSVTERKHWTQPLKMFKYTVTENYLDEGKLLTVY
jgi:hypothetical protein